MKIIRLFTAAAIVFQFTVGCTSNFLITKDGKSYFFGSRDVAIYKMLCESGDLKMILANTKLPNGTKADLYKYNCTAPSKQGLKEVVSSMTPEQRKDLRLSFQVHGYNINRINC